MIDSILAVWHSHVVQFIVSYLTFCLVVGWIVRERRHDRR